MNLLLNIGLSVNDGSSLDADAVLRLLKHRGFRVLASALHHSNTEPTLVAQGELPAGLEAEFGHAVAVDCRQDCIALYNTAQAMGQLAGPKACAWGPFNPDFFLMLDGRTLSP